MAYFFLLNESLSDFDALHNTRFIALGKTPISQPGETLGTKKAYNR